MENTYTTSRGYKIQFKSIPTLLQKLAAQFPVPKPPTYQVKNAGGVMETHEHYLRIVKEKKKLEDGSESDEVIEVEQTSLETPEERQEWAKYEAALGAHAVQLVRAQMRLMLLEGITVVGKSQSDWEKRQRFIGFEIPEDPLERELHFMETEISASAEDVLAILAGVSRESGVDEEVVSGLEDSFRRAVGRQTAERIKDTANQERMDNGESVRANGHSHMQDEPNSLVVGQSV